MSFLQNFNFSSFPSTYGGGTSYTQQPTHFGIPNRFSTSPNLNNISPAHIQQNLHQYQNLQIPQSIQRQPQLKQSSVDYYGNPVAHQHQQTQRQTLTPQVLSSPVVNHNNYHDDTIDDYYDPVPAPAPAPVPVPVQPPRSATIGRRRKSKKVSQRNILHYPHDLRVTPIQGPIYARDGLVPVVPLYAYSAVSNGTFYQIPILWTALSVALGLEVRGEILRGLPCIKRLNQLFCPTAGNTYPLESIERFIDENKALIKRMYGEFAMLGSEEYGPVGGSVGNILRRSAREVYEEEVPDYIAKEHSNGNHTRKARQTVNPRTGGPTEQPKSNRVDSCESKVEITTPYWAANSAGKVRAIVNTQHFEQAIHQEVCAKTSTARCTGDCGCEQKYKWHRLLAYDPDNDCKGIFMDWFLFPSCCVCRCNP